MKKYNTLSITALVLSICGLFIPFLGIIMPFITIPMLVLIKKNKDDISYRNRIFMRVSIIINCFTLFVWSLSICVIILSNTALSEHEVSAISVSCAATLTIVAVLLYIFLPREKRKCDHSDNCIKSGSQIASSQSEKELVFAKWFRDGKSGEELIIFEKRGMNCIIKYISVYPNEYRTPPTEEKKEQLREISFDAIFEWYLSETMSFINDTYSLKLNLEDCIDEDQYRRWIVNNTKTKKPAYYNHIGNAQEQYVLCAEFQMRTEIVLVLESQYYERIHYLAVDKEDGTPYEVYSKVVGVCGVSYASSIVEDFEKTPRIIDYNEFLEIAEKYHPGSRLSFAGINESNWREYIDLHI